LRTIAEHGDRAGASAIHKLARERFLRHLDQRIRETETADRAR